MRGHADVRCANFLLGELGFSAGPLDDGGCKGPAVHLGRPCTRTPRQLHQSLRRRLQSPLSKGNRYQSTLYL